MVDELGDREALGERRPDVGDLLQGWRCRRICWVFPDDEAVPDASIAVATLADIPGVVGSIFAGGDHGAVLFPRQARVQVGEGLGEHVVVQREDVLIDEQGRKRRVVRRGGHVGRQPLHIVGVSYAADHGPRRRVGDVVQAHGHAERLIDVVARPGRDRGIGVAGGKSEQQSADDPGANHVHKLPRRLRRNSPKPRSAAAMEPPVARFSRPKQPAWERSSSITSCTQSGSEVAYTELSALYWRRL